MTPRGRAPAVSVAAAGSLEVAQTRADSTLRRRGKPAGRRRAVARRWNDALRAVPQKLEGEIAALIARRPPSLARPERPIGALGAESGLACCITLQTPPQRELILRAALTRSSWHKDVSITIAGPALASGRPTQLQVQTAPECGPAGTIHASPTTQSHSCVSWRVLIPDRQIASRLLNRTRVERGHGKAWTQSACRLPPQSPTTRRFPRGEWAESRRVTLRIGTKLIAALQHDAFTYASPRATSKPTSLRGRALVYRAEDLAGFSPRESVGALR